MSKEEPPPNMYCRIYDLSHANEKVDVPSFSRLVNRTPSSPSSLAASYYILCILHRTELCRPSSHPAHNSSFAFLLALLAALLAASTTLCAAALAELLACSTDPFVVAPASDSKLLLATANAPLTLFVALS